MGVAASTPTIRDRAVAEFLREADVSLYAAKNKGRNRVEIFSESAKPASAGQS
jgi:PleD family two-component response regulator